MGRVATASEVTASRRDALGAARSVRRPSTVRTRQRRGRRGRMVAVVAVLAVVAALIVAHPWADHQVRHVSFLPASTVPTGYHVVYAEGGPGAASTEEIWVRRPFESVDQTLSGPPPGATLFVSTISRLGHQVLRAGPTAQAALVNVPVAAAPPDVRLDAVYAAALDAHLIEFRRDDVVAGRRCAVVRSAQSLRNPPLLAFGAHPTSYTDTCVDEAGLILREQTVRDGAIAASRTAVSVAVGPAAGDDGAYAVRGVPTPSDQGGGSITRLTPDSLPPGRTWILPQAPPGFTLTGRYVVVPPQPQAYVGTPGGSAAAAGAPTAVVVTMEDVYVRGADVLVVEQGSASNGAAFAPPTGARPVDLGLLGTGQLVLAATASSVVAEPGGESKFVRVTGTLDPRLLVQDARALVAVDRGSQNTLVTIPGAVP